MINDVQSVKPSVIRNLFNSLTYPVDYAVALYKNDFKGFVTKHACITPESLAEYSQDEAKLAFHSTIFNNMLIQAPTSLLTLYAMTTSLPIIIASSPLLILFNVGLQSQTSDILKLSVKHDKSNKRLNLPVDRMPLKEHVSKNIKQAKTTVLNLPKMQLDCIKSSVEGDHKGFISRHSSVAKNDLAIYSKAELRRHFFVRAAIPTTASSFIGLMGVAMAINAPLLAPIGALIIGAAAGINHVAKDMHKASIHKEMTQQKLSRIL